MVKLSPNVTSIVDIARAAADNGVDSLALVNTFLGMSIDIKTRRSHTFRKYAGLSGPAIKPLALRQVHEVFNAVKIPVVGMGGISCWQDAAEFMIAGAALVQVGTATLSDPLSMPKIIKGLADFCRENAIKNISELTGSFKEA